MQDCVTLVSGGDDQAARVAVFRMDFGEKRNGFTNGGNCEATAAVDGLSVQLTLLSDCQVVSAHTSAIRVSKTLTEKATAAGGAKLPKAGSSWHACWNARMSDVDYQPRSMPTVVSLVSLPCNSSWIAFSQDHEKDMIYDTFT